MNMIFNVRISEHAQRTRPKLLLTAPEIMLEEALTSEMIRHISRTHQAPAGAHASLKELDRL